MRPSSKRQKSAKKIYRVQVLERAFQILNLLADEKSGIGPMEVAQRLKLHKSTAHRLIMVLEASRFVEKNTISGKNHLGSRLMELGLSAVSRLDVYEVAGPHLRTLVRDWRNGPFGRTPQWAGRLLGQLREQSNIAYPATVGTRTPAHCTSLGKAMLAFAPQDHIDEFLRGRNYCVIRQNDHFPCEIQSQAACHTRTRLCDR